MIDIDRILTAALSPTKYPSQELNDKIMMKMKESGEMKEKKKHSIMVAAIIACLLVVPTSVYAAYQYLKPAEVATKMEDKKLSEAFDNNCTETAKSIVDGSYKVTYLGQVTGKSISERTGSAWELHPDRTYIAVAIEKADGTAMTNEDGTKWFISPLIQGLKPWSYNIASMNGSFMEKVIDGVLYRIIECDNIEIFADKKIYLAVSDTVFFNLDAFSYDEGTEVVTVNEAYKGTNVLFELTLDSSKADPKKAEAYLKKLEKEWALESNTDEENDKSVNDKSASENSVDEKSTNETSASDKSVSENSVDEKSKCKQQEIFLDKENGITIHVKDNDSSRWWANETAAETVLTYYFEVEGDGIESLSYTLNQGEFCDNPESKLDERNLFGNKCSLNYEDQKSRNYQYSILFSAKFEDYRYTNDYVYKLGEDDPEERAKVYYEVLDKEIKTTSGSLEIKMKDGRVINKEIRFDNVLSKGGFGITMNVE